jgi:hypothetical protein
MNNLGKLAKDKITGFTGIITAYIQYLTGCHQYGIQPNELKDGKIIEVNWFDVKRIDIIGEGVSVEDVSEVSNSGGPQDVPHGISH